LNSTSTLPPAASSATCKYTKHTFSQNHGLMGVILRNRPRGS
jgi:hypothetical protein